MRKIVSLLLLMVCVLALLPVMELSAAPTRTHTRQPTFSAPHTAPPHRSWSHTASHTWSHRSFSHTWARSHTIRQPIVTVIQPPQGCYDASCYPNQYHPPYPQYPSFQPYVTVTESATVIVVSTQTQLSVSISRTTTTTNVTMTQTITDNSALVWYYGALLVALFFGALYLREFCKPRQRFCIYCGHKLGE